MMCEHAVCSESIFFEGLLYRMQAFRRRPSVRAEPHAWEREGVASVAPSLVRSSAHTLLVFPCADAYCMLVGIPMRRRRAWSWSPYRPKKGRAID